MFDVIVDAIRAVIQNGECVALFVISLCLIFALHISNLRRLGTLGRRLEDHEKTCGKEG